MAFGKDYIIERLTQQHDTSPFNCGNDALNLWLKRFGWINTQNDSARVYVAHAGDGVVTGYYALTAGEVAREQASQRVSRGLAAHPIGVAVLTRLAVDAEHQGQRLGITLLQDALRRIDQAADIIAIRAVLVQAINANARRFYLRFGFSPSPVDDLRLMLMMKDLRAFLKAQR